MRFLLEHGADVNAQQDDLSTPLHLAVRAPNEQSVDIANLLLERDADPHARDKDYATPWLLARYLMEGSISQGCCSTTMRKPPPRMIKI